jgi:2Fe-2S ferredoxin
MARIVIDNIDKKSLEIADFSKTLLRHLQDHSVDWMHACGAKGRCTTCKFRVLSGSENIDVLTGAEDRYRRTGALRENERLACQARITGSVTIAVPEECKLPHIRYSY